MYVYEFIWIHERGQVDQRDREMFLRKVGRCRKGVDMADATQNGRRDFVKSFAYTFYPCIDEVSPNNYYEQHTNILKYLITRGRS